jgi:hypothetical protein
MLTCGRTTHLKIVGVATARFRFMDSFRAS